MQHEYLPIEGHPDYVKDSKSSALLNTDHGALQEYKNKMACSQVSCKVYNL